MICLACLIAKTARHISGCFENDGDQHNEKCGAFICMHSFFCGMCF